MNEPLARSPRTGTPAQRYVDHIDEVRRGAALRASRAADFYCGGSALGRGLVGVVEAAAIYHDLGKLDPQNQEVLGQISQKRLEVPHEDAGTKALLDLGQNEAAILVHGHHAGLFDAEVEKKKQQLAFRRRDHAAYVGRHLPEYLSLHEQAGCDAVPPIDAAPLDPSGFARRVAISCLVDADHSDSAIHVGEQEAAWEKRVPPRWRDRLDALDRYVEMLGSRCDEATSLRQRLRNDLYAVCRDADKVRGIRSCEAPVGSGKTTAVMAHLLRVAEEHSLRHIFVVLPYTNIIRQSVRVYREALVLPGEAPEDIVAEHHHQADFSDPRLRHLTTLWRSPIIVTTAVQFFETLAASATARLRKLHELPGSAAFIDEAHAAIPSDLWPQAWRWLTEWTDAWGGHLVLASGSLARFWENEELVEPDGEPRDVRDLASDELRRAMEAAESRRVRFHRREESLSLSALREIVGTKPGPRLLILNTIQSAAVVAYALREAGSTVLHLSTALTPVHRDPIVDRVHLWLKETRDGLRDPDWTLVATSCVEAGMDFSFDVGFRESASMASILQVSGRVNREAGREEAEVWDFRLDDVLCTKNRSLAIGQRVLGQLFVEEKINTESPTTLTSEAFGRELTQGALDRATKIVSFEVGKRYPEVAAHFKVIDQDDRMVVVDAAIVARLQRGEHVPAREVLRNSVRLRPRRITELDLAPVFPAPEGKEPELWAWSGPYDPDFLGYMEALMPSILADTRGGYIEA